MKIVKKSFDIFKKSLNVAKKIPEDLVNFVTRKDD